MDNWLCITFSYLILCGIYLENGRMESVSWRSFYGILKIGGMFIAVGGAMLLSFYRGPPVGSSTETPSQVGGQTKNLFVGPLLMAYHATEAS